jgi:hypothetical protein
LHYPKQQYARKYPDNPFISYAKFDARVDKTYGYPIPYRCFYSRNVPNLFMAGRCISVTHEALGTVRVMKTCGMMGEVVGRAASICSKEDCLPRDVYQEHWDQLDQLLKLPGLARRKSVDSEILIPSNALPAAPAEGPPSGLDPQSLPGVVIDDTKAQKSGRWSAGRGLKGYIGWSYLYAGNNSGAEARFPWKPPTPGRYEVRLAYLAHENRGTQVPVQVTVAGRSEQLKINMRQAAPLDNDFISLGTFSVAAGQTIEVMIGCKDAGGNTHVDAVQFLPAD